jgi:BASS family bile acid:Na+ symporter
MTGISQTAQSAKKRGCLRGLPLLGDALNRHLIWLVLGSYLIAALFPAVGLRMRDLTFWNMSLFSEHTAITLPMLLLAFLLLNAGFGMKMQSITNWSRKVRIVGVGLVGNLVIPVLYIFVLSRAPWLWQSQDDLGHVLLGLAIVASMPIAGSSTAWAQNGDGDMTVSLGLILLSTLLSPIATPLALHSVGYMASGFYAKSLHDLAQFGTGAFLAVFVFAPSLAGIVVRAASADSVMGSVKPLQRFSNTLCLIALSYTNAAVSLPQFLKQPNLRFLVPMLLAVGVLCLLAFASGWWISRLLDVTWSQRTALIFGLGMNNNGTGLVLASVLFARHPAVMLPIISYTLIQHLVAALVLHSLQKQQSQIR